MHINETPEIYLTEGEIIIKPELCAKEEKREVPVEGAPSEGEKGGPVIETGEEMGKTREERYSKLTLKLNVPVGQISTVAKLTNYLSSEVVR